MLLLIIQDTLKDKKYSKKSKNDMNYKKINLSYINHVVATMY